MQLLTKDQKLWLLRRTIRIGEAYPFPRFGFTLYSEPKYSKGEYIDTNPFTKSLDLEAFFVKDKVNGFCRGNFERNPKGADMYITEDELSRRDFMEVIFFTLLTVPFMLLWNGFIWIIKKRTNGQPERRV